MKFVLHPIPSNPPRELNYWKMSPEEFAKSLKDFRWTSNRAMVKLLSNLLKEYQEKDLQYVDSKAKDKVITKEYRALQELTIQAHYSAIQLLKR